MLVNSESRSSERILPSITTNSAAKPVWDVIVVGAGPAGSIAAGQLARRGKRVLLIDRDRFPRWKICGACFNLNTLAHLETAGVDGTFSGCSPVRLGSFTMGVDGRSVTLALPGGAVLSRHAFDAMLIRDAMRHGVEFLDDTHCKLNPPEENSTQRSLSLRNGREIVAVSARVVLAASGLHTDWLGDADGFETTFRRASRIGIGAVSTCDQATALDRMAAGNTAFAVDSTSSETSSQYLAGRIYMAVSSEGYVGLTRQEDGTLNMAAALNRESLGHNQRPADAAREILTSAGFPLPGDLDGIRWQGTPPLTRCTMPVARHRVFLLGDAAGYVEPFTGEGMAWAVSSGLAVVPFVMTALERTGEINAIDVACDGWIREHRRLSQKGQRLCRSVAWILRFPTAIHWAIPVLHRLPALAQLFIRRINGSRKS